MNNLNDFGKKYLYLYLADYRKGLLSFDNLKAYLGCCFDDRGEQ